MFIVFIQTLSYLREIIQPVKGREKDMAARKINDPQTNIQISLDKQERVNKIPEFVIDKCRCLTL